MIDSVTGRLDGDPRMERCLLCSSSPVQWHHALQYAGKKLEDWWAIQPLCYKCHMGNSMKPNKRARLLSEICAISMGIACGEIYRYGKRDWDQELASLEKTYAQLFT